MQVIGSGLTVRRFRRLSDGVEFVESADGLYHGHWFKIEAADGTHHSDRVKFAYPVNGCECYVSQEFGYMYALV